jgi:hypothetical protein
MADTLKKITKPDVRNETNPLRRAHLALKYHEQSGHPNNADTIRWMREGFNILVNNTVDPAKTWGEIA